MSVKRKLIFIKTDDGEDEIQCEEEFTVRESN